MSSLNFKNSSWLRNYFLHRIKIPFPLDGQYFEITTDKKYRARDLKKLIFPNFRC